MDWMVYLIIIAVMSFISFGLYATNYKSEVFERCLISESVMLYSGVLFGSLGAIFAMLIFRYKIRSKTYWIINLICLAFQILFFLLFYYKKLG